MQLDLSKIAIALSLTAIALSFWYPIDQYFRDLHETEMAEQAASPQPQFTLASYDLDVGHTYSIVTVRNRGDGDAHNVRVSLLFQPVNFSYPGKVIAPNWDDYVWIGDEFIAKVESGGYQLVHFTIGVHHMESVVPADAAWNFTNYEADVSISCDEAASVTRHFSHRQFCP